MIYVQMAWANLWRNKNRTLITVSSVFFAVVLVLFIRSMKLGSYNHIITNTLSLYTGFIQVQGKGFNDTKSLENSMALSDTQLMSVKSINEVTSVVPRIESFALASVKNRTEGVSVTGTDPKAEAAMNGLNGRVTNGKYLDPHSKGALVGEGLARRLNVLVGDTLVLLSQGYYGMSAAGIFAVEGIIRLPLPDLDNSMLYLTLPTAQWFLSMQGRVTSLAVMIENPDKENQVAAKVRKLFSDNYDVLTWRELIPDLLQGIEFSNASGIIMLSILYLVIAFGIFGTVIMMTAERRREFSIMISIGMKPKQLSFMVFIETVVIAMLGAVSGAVASLPVLLYMKANPIPLSGQLGKTTLQYGFEPILPFLVSASLFVHQGVVVFVIALMVSMYPLWSINRINISDELRA
ncbi:MAG: ABC transporter permease [Chitinispirillales bacterium]|nr:ABC transporter permease [Chitinispirillales bacterium]